MKIILGALNAKFVHSNLAIRYIKEYCHDYEIESYETSINDSLLDTALSIIDKKPDVLAFSCYIWNVEATIKVCSIVKEVLKNTLIVLGGPEVSFNGEEYLEKYGFIDFVVRGEGEDIFKRLLGEIEAEKKDYEKVDGLIFRRNSEIILNKEAKPLPKLDDIPFPYREGIPQKIVYYEASRGCPFGCSYCLSGGAEGVRFFSLHRIKEDLAFLINNDVELVKFVDRTFNANKSLALEIWEFLIKKFKNTKFHFEIAADLLDDKMISFLGTAPKGLFQFEVGIQTTNEGVLRNINRLMDFGKVKENLLKLKRNGNIHCHIDLIAGLPGEGIESFVKSFEECMEIKPDVLQLGFLKVLKGSAVFNESRKYGIHYVKHPNYQVLFTADMSYEAIRELIKFEKVFETYYNSGNFKMSINYLLEFADSKFDFFKAFSVFLEGRGFLERNLDLKDKFKMLFDFSAPFCSENLIRDILIHDFISTTKKSVLPDFLKKEYSDNIKNLLYDNREKLELYFGGYDNKKLFGIPVEVKILGDAQGYYYLENVDSILVFNPSSGEYCYL